MMERTQFQTHDGVTIIGDAYRPATPPRGAVLLIPMMPARRSSWQPFATKLAEIGYFALVIDLRGHGDSLHQGEQTLDYQTFSDAEHQASREDVLAAVEWLKDHEQFPAYQIGFVGASIGANLALEALANSAQATWAVLLSPGLNYHGLETKPLIERLTAPKRLYLAASTDDLYSFQSLEQLVTVTTLPITTKILVNAGHGTAMFDNQPSFIDEVINWITTNDPPKS